MTGSSNPGQFRTAYSQLRDRYDRLFGKAIAELRQQYKAGPTKSVPADKAAILEAHLRAFLINGLLAALNWRLGSEPETGLWPLDEALNKAGNLYPEVPVLDASSGNTIFLDYLGLDAGKRHPLLIVETKHPDSQLPRVLSGVVKHSPATSVRERQRAEVEEAIRSGLEGQTLVGDWNEWLAKVREYFRSTGSAARRVVMTDGEWFIVLREPLATFSNPRAGRIDIYLSGNSPDDHEVLERYEEFFLALDFRRIELPIALPAAALPFYVEGAEVARAFHGLRVRYCDPGVYRQPSIAVAPIVILVSHAKSVVHVEGPHKNFELTRRKAALKRHLKEVDDAAKALLADINARIGTAFVPQPISDLYADAELFSRLPGVRPLDDDEYLVVTGSGTHFTTETPSVVGCGYHNWARAKEEGEEATAQAVTAPSVLPRAFFISSEDHHCAHRTVLTTKTGTVAGLAKVKGERSGTEFCELLPIDEHLCCRTCSFQEVCQAETAVFMLPCPAASLAPITRASTGPPLPAVSSRCD